MFKATLSAIVALALAASAAAQSVQIDAPPANATLSLGQSFIVDVERPNSLTGSQDIAIAIGLLSCVNIAPAGTCDGVNTTGDIGPNLYYGPYTPQLPSSPPPFGGPRQNFTVQVPSNFEVGPAMLSVAHFALIIGVEPFLDVTSEMVYIVA